MMTHGSRWRIYKLDLVATAILIATAVGVYMVAIQPEQEQARRGGELSRALNAAQTQVAATRSQLDSLAGDIEHLRKLVEERLDDAPEATRLNEIRGQIVAHAKNAGLDIKSILPQPTRPHGEYLASDLQILAHGHLDALIIFLDTLGTEHPYHSVQEYSLSRDEAHDDGRCEVSISLRLHLLPEDPGLALGGQP